MYTTYTGERVRIRPFRDLAEWDSLGLVGIEEPGEHWGPWHEPLQENHPLFNDHGGLDPAEEYCWAVEEIASGRLIGEENMHPQKMGCWLGTHILPEYRGRGYGVEAKLLAAGFAFDNYAVENVYAVTLSAHGRAIRGLELCGMRCIGCQPVSFHSRGGYTNRVYYNMTRPDWMAADYRHGIARS